MIFRYIGWLLITALLTLIGLFITPVNYFIKEWLRSFKNVTWWFLNDFPVMWENDIDAGDFGRFKHNFIGFYRQNAIRNSHWNARMLMRPKYEKPYAETGNLQEIDLIWNVKEGFNYGTFKMFEKKYFRLTGIIKILWFYSHIQIGLSKNDYKEGSLYKRGRYYLVIKGGVFNKLIK